MLTCSVACSPEGNNFVVLLYAAWRDCIFTGLCEKPSTKRTLN
jgi:hypothetical protein